jgi:predicted MPP superfamily phosphohydrolase
MKKYTEEEIAFIVHNKMVSRRSWKEITFKFNKKFNKKLHENTIKTCYDKYHNIDLKEDYSIKLLKDTHRTKKANSYRLKENKIVLESLTNQDELIEIFKGIVSSAKIAKYTPPKKLIFNNKKKKDKKDKMTLEGVLSDIHYGKLTTNEDGSVKVNSEEIRKRVKKLSSQTIKEIKRSSDHFEVERFIVAMLGDLIESSHIHDAESVMGCEFGTSKQITVAVESIFNDYILPIAMTGIKKIDVICVTGNHDRLTKQPTYIKPGENNLTYIIYTMLELLCKNSGLNNVKFKIAKKMYAHDEIYGNTVVYEHGQEVKSLNRKSLTDMLDKRQNQIRKIVSFYRMGHYHERVEYGQGRIQVNGSVPGQDDYSEGKGFDSEALQMLNFYVKTNKRRTCFFRSFPIFLEEIK